MQKPFPPTIPLFLFLLSLCMLAAPIVCLGGGAIQCANLIYAGTHTSRCFSDQFLSTMQQETAIATERRFKSVKLESEELFQYPFVVMTGESDFHLTRKEREHLSRYLKDGGFLLASAGCSSKAWDQAFRREMRRLFEDVDLARLPMEHPVFRTVYDITKLELHHKGSEALLEALTLNGNVVVIYSAQGLNDTAHTEGCCCCGGNEIENSLQVNVNILAYALLH